MIRSPKAGQFRWVLVSHGWTWRRQAVVKGARAVQKIEKTAVKAPATAKKTTKRAAKTAPKTVRKTTAKAAKKTAAPRKRAARSG